MRILPVLIAATGLAGTVVVLGVTAAHMRAPAEQPADAAREIRQSVPARPTVAPPKLTATSSRPVVEQPVEPGSAGRPATPGRVEPASPRSVAPSIIAMPPVDPQTLERVEARPPLSEIAQAVPPKKPPPKPLLFQPVAEAAGIIIAGGRTITIAGIAPVPDGEMCDRQGGGTWPCGRAARSAFRAFLRGRAVTCDFPEGEVPDRLSTTCRLGPRDIGAWLAENGWARTNGDAYATQAKAAQDAGRGIFGPGPASLPAETSGLDIAPTPNLPPAGDAGPAGISILPSEDGASGSPEAASPQPSPPQTGDTGTLPAPSTGQGVGDPLPPPVSPLARPAPQ